MCHVPNISRPSQISCSKGRRRCGEPDVFFIGPLEWLGLVGASLLLRTFNYPASQVQRSYVRLAAHFVELASISIPLSSVGLCRCRLLCCRVQSSAVSLGSGVWASSIASLLLDLFTIAAAVAILTRRFPRRGWAVGAPQLGGLTAGGVNGNCGLAGRTSME